MADGVNESRELVRAADEHTAKASLPASLGVGDRASAAEQTSPHAHKFRAVTAALVGLAVGALVVALVLAASNGSNAPAPQWSAWSPPDSGVQGAREIADHLAPFYRISPVDQLDVITVANVNNSAAAAAASAASSSSSSSGSGLEVAVNDPSSNQVSLIGGNTVAYNLCGIGTSNCAIGVGTPSSDRLLLLRREALELALYTFKYISGTQNVVAILPPGHTTQSSTLTAKPPSAKSKPVTKPLDVALLFLKDELKPWLDHPLSTTFPEEFPPTVPELGLWKQTAEAALVEQITARGLFSERVVQAQDGSNLLLLNPLPPS